jgi:lipid II:glycine glycyltransferase (peptidoglycan interpeptide bridge formation enzyme)
MKSTWNQLINDFDNPHLLQSSEWADVKQEVGWIPYYLVWSGDNQDVKLLINNDGAFDPGSIQAAALVLKRQLLPGFSVLYLPKGPLLSDWGDPLIRERVVRDLEEFSRTHNVLQIKIDPDVIIGEGIPGEENEVDNQIGLSFQEELMLRGWQFSPEQIQYRNTVLVDLRDEEDKLLSRMKSKTRYNIRLSSRKGIEIRLGDVTDLPILYQMYANTSLRGGFAIRGEEYYLSLWKTFLGDRNRFPSDPVAQPLIAEFEGRPVAGAVIFKFGKSCARRNRCSAKSKPS